MPIDFDRIRREYPLPDIVAASGEKLTKDGDEWRCCCPFHAEDTPSFTIYRDGSSVWKYHCFGCGAHGDNIDFVKERYGKDVAEAVKIIDGEDAGRTRPLDKRKWQSESRSPYEGYEIGRPPPETPPILARAKTPPLLNPKRIDPKTGKPKLVVYVPSMVFPYLTRDGELIGYVLRVEISMRGKTEKITPGIWWTKNEAANFEGWSHGSFPAPRPLYGLDRLARRPNAQVLLVEGEKCADAGNALAQEVGKQLVAVTWMGGGKSLKKVDWSPLAGRSVIIWPDNDPEGWRTAMGWAAPGGEWHKGLCDYAFDAGAVKIKIVHITAGARPDGWDIADGMGEIGARGVDLLMKERIREWPREKFEEWKQKQIAKEAPQDVDPQRMEGISPGKPDLPTHQGNGAVPSENRDARGQASIAAEPVEQHARATNGAAGAGNGEIERPQQMHHGEPINEDTWRRHLIMKADGDGIKANSLQNAALLLQYERRFADIFAWNEFAKEVYLQRRPPWDVSGTMGHWHRRKITEPDVTSTACWLEYLGMSIKTNDVGKVINRVAQHNVYNPVAERLEQLQQKWDGMPRLSGGGTDDGDSIEPWLTEYMGAADTEENRAFGRKWMIGAVARALQPGCKLDTMLVLEGPQGLKKSTALRIIADAVVEGVFTDEISDPNSKDAGLQMQGAWIIEIAELDAFRRAEITQIKAWLSRQTDRFRRPYGKIVEEFPRSCVFAGTVNPIGIGYLKDPSGGRRFWPVAVENIDLARLARDAEQLWAEAVVAYKRGEKWWLEGSEIAYATIAQEQRYEEDPYAQMIDAYLRGKSVVSTLTIMDYLDIPKERRNSIVNRRIVAHLHRRDWTRTDAEKGVYESPRSQRLV